MGMSETDRGEMVADNGYHDDNVVDDSGNDDNIKSDAEDEDQDSNPSSPAQGGYPGSICQPW